MGKEKDGAVLKQDKKELIKRRAKNAISKLQKTIGFFQGITIKVTTFSSVGKV